MRRIPVNATGLRIIAFNGDGAKCLAAANRNGMEAARMLREIRYGNILPPISSYLGLPPYFFAIYPLFLGKRTCQAVVLTVCPKCGGRLSACTGGKVASSALAVLC